jgi:hypothetical protein
MVVSFVATICLLKKRLTVNSIRCLDNGLQYSCFKALFTESLPSNGLSNTYTQSKHTETSMPVEGFEPMILAYKRAKTVHGLERTVTVTALG